MQTRTHHRTIALAAASALAASIAMTRAPSVEGQTPAAGSFPFRAQEIAQDFGVGYAVVSGDVNGDGQTDILAISGDRAGVVQARRRGRRSHPRRRRDHRRQRDARAARHRRRRPARHRARRRVDAAEHRHAAVGPAERARRDAGLGSVPDLGRADAAPDQMGGRRRRQAARADRRAAARQGREGPGLGRAERAAARLPAAGRIRETDPWPMEVAGEANHIQHNFLPFNADNDPQDEMVTASKEGLRRRGSARRMARGRARSSAKERPAR